MPRRRCRAAGRKVTERELEARCLEILDEVASTRRPILVMRGDRVRARIEPIGSEPPGLWGSVLGERDLTDPTGERWDAER